MGRKKSSIAQANKAVAKAKAAEELAKQQRVEKANAERVAAQAAIEAEKPVNKLGLSLVGRPINEEEVTVLFPHASFQSMRDHKIRINKSKPSQVEVYWTSYSALTRETTEHIVNLNNWDYHVIEKLYAAIMWNSNPKPVGKSISVDETEDTNWGNVEDWQL